MPDIGNIVNNQSLINDRTIKSKPSVTPAEAHSQFASNLKHAIEGVNKAQVDSNEMTKALARGEVDDLHDVMITSQKASITMKTTVEVQNKVVEAYKEIMRMQV